MKTRKRVLNIVIAGIILYGFSACGSGLEEINDPPPTSPSNKYGKAKYGQSKFTP